MINFLCFCGGWFVGSAMLWWWFYYHRLIRSRDEWERVCKPWANKGEPEELP